MRQNLALRVVTRQEHRHSRGDHGLGAVERHRQQRLQTQLQERAEERLECEEQIDFLPKRTIQIFSDFQKAICEDSFATENYERYTEQIVRIQKNWRGVYTQRLLREYFEQLFIESQQLLHEQNLLGLNKSQQYLYQQTAQNLIIPEDDREDFSESNTVISKVKKVKR